MVAAASGSQMTRSASRPTSTAPLARPRPARRAGARESQRAERLDRHASRRGAGPHRRETELERRDAAPRADEVAGVLTLQRRRRRRVIGRDEIDIPCAERVPQPLPMIALADGRRALERGCAVGNLFGGKRQVVRARFDGERQTRGAGLANRRQRVGRRQMDDVDARAVVARQPHEQSMAASSLAGGRLASHVA